PPQRTRLLDVGCSSGAFLADAKKFGFLETGVEPAAEPVKTAREFGLNVRQGFLHDLRFPDEAFDVITLFEVIEHLREPMELLRECRRILRREGIMVIGTGNAESWTVRLMKGDWDYFMNHGGHVSFYNPMSLAKLAGRAGFRVVRRETRGCSLYRRDQVSEMRYAISKVVREIMGLPAKLFDKGHDMVLFLKKA
ncbi:MAG TPA: class I SAM-dependent methyltransferase, partial [Nitrospirota bacterium]|nr:class I SAM-dependent methyltransferase [Nitrospirota bacterium]